MVQGGLEKVQGSFKNGTGGKMGKKMLQGDKWATKPGTVGEICKEPYRCKIDEKTVQGGKIKQNDTWVSRAKKIEQGVNKILILV